MRILYFSPRDCWPIDTGARLRDFHLANALAQREKLTYLGFQRPGESVSESVLKSTAGPAGEIDCLLAPPPPRYSPVRILRGLIGPRPISVLNYATDTMRTELIRLLQTERFDAIQIEGVHLFEYLPLLREAPGKPAIIADWHNIESELLYRYADTSTDAARRLYARRTAHLLSKAEDQLLAIADAHIVCSERERQRLSERAPKARIQVIGNGVDVPFYAGTGPIMFPEGHHDLVYVGSMDYHANIDAAEHFARSILPVLQQTHPELRFVIVGARPSKEVLALATLHGVTVTGTVDDVRPYYRNAFAVVVPLRVGGGTRLKILEAMASRVPVVSTTLGAEGLDAIDDVNLLIADEPEQFRQALDRLSAPPNWIRLAGAGLDLVESRYGWPMLGESLHRIYQQVLAERG